MPQSPPVLVYHEITQDLERDLNSTSFRLFRRQLEVLSEKGYTICGVTDLLRRRKSWGKLVGLTFDDGYESFFSVVAPLLKKMGIGATVFLPSDSLLRPDLMPYRTMSVTHATSIASDGFEIGSHGKSHLHLTRLGPMALEQELRSSRTAIAETLHTVVDGLAYPFGAANGKVIASVQNAGYSYACVSSIIPLRQLLHFNRYLIPRIDVSRRSPDIAFSLVRGYQTIVSGESLRSYSFTLKNWRKDQDRTESSKLRTGG